MLPYRRTMFFSRIPFVLVPIIIRIFLMQTIHVIITVCLCQNGCCCNGKELAVSFYHSSVWQILIFMKTVAINQQMFRTDFQLIYSPMHGQKRSFQYIDLVNLFWSDDSYRPSKSLTFDNLTQLVSLTLCQLLGIIQQIILEIRWKNHRSRIYRSGQTSTSCLITSGLNYIFI